MDYMDLAASCPRKAVKLIDSLTHLLPDGTKPLSKLMLTNHKWGLLAFTWRQFHRKCSKLLSLIWLWRLQQHLPGVNELTKCTIPRHQWVNSFFKIKFTIFIDFFSIPLMVNSLWPNDAIWQHRSRSTLAQVMACCLTAPSHYLNQRWLIITKVQWCSSEGNFPWDITVISC